jgi:hypothetical protein
MWQQIDSPPHYLCRTLYGAMSSDEHPLKTINSAVMIIVINGDYRVHHVWLLQNAIYE